MNKEGVGYGGRVSQIDRAVAGFTGWLIDVMPKTIEGKEHIEPVRAHIENDGSVIPISNHISLFDPPVSSAVMKDQLSGLIFKAIVFLSSKFEEHFYDDLANDEKLARDPSVIAGIRNHKENYMGPLASGVIHASAKANGIELITVVQSYMMGTGKFARYNADVDTEALKRASEAIKAGPTVMGIAPEGTRSKKGVLLQAEKGVLRIVRDPVVADKTLFLPLAIQGSDFHLQNLGARATLSIGEPISTARLREDAQRFVLEPQDVLMLRVAAMLPAKMHGYYADPGFAPYLSSITRVRNPSA